MADGTESGAASATSERDQFIPIRKTDIIGALLDHGALNGKDRDLFRQACRLLASIYHYEYFEQLEKLRDAYFYFDPDVDPHARFDAATLDHAYKDLIEAFNVVLKGGNFVEMPHAEIEQHHRKHALIRVNVRAPRDDFRDVRFFRRGHHHVLHEVSGWFGLRKRTVEVPVYDDVVLMVAMKSAAELASSKEVKRLARHMIRPGAVLIKYFRNIAASDLNALFPNVRVVLGWRDMAMLILPALAGTIPLVLKIASTITVLFVVLGFYLGVRGAVEDNEMKTALAALSALVAFGGFLMRQWVKYQRQSLRYQKLLTDNIYFRNVNNNAGIFDYMIGAAEEQETKEAFLAYYFLLTSPTPPTQEELDQRIEAWLKEHFGVDIDFEVDDALGKLQRLDLLGHDGEHLSVVPLSEALVRLDRLWEGYFRYNETAAGAA